VAHVKPEHFSNAIHRFLASLDSVAELSAFATEYVPGLDRDEAAFVALASARFPNAPEGHHAAAGELMRQSFAEAREQLQLLESEGDGREAALAASIERSGLLVRLQKSLEDLTGDRFAYYLYSQVWREALRRPARLSMMRASLLTTAVGEFENLVASLVREFLRQRPEILKSDDAKYALSEIEGFATLDAFLAYGREKYADSPRASTRSRG